MAVAEPEETLAWEGRRRPLAAVAAIVAALSLIGSWIIPALSIGQPDRAWFGESLERVSAATLAGEDSGALPSLRTGIFQIYERHGTALLLGAFVAAIGALALGWALHVLARATRARREEFPRPFVVLPLVAGVMSAIAALASVLTLDAIAGEFLDGPRTVQAASDVEVSPSLLAAQYIGLFGQNLLVPLAFVFIAFNAMKAGLLTRFLGILGIIAGVLILLPIPTPIPPVQIFWLAALGLLFAGRLPGGMPPAWRTGRAEPWPSPSEVQATRDRERRGEPVAAAAARPATRPPSSNRKKKRKPGA
jgi:hypothetical protein